MKSIALDAMGGDFGPPVVVGAALKILKQYPQVQLLLVGQREAIEPLLAAGQQEGTTFMHRCQIIHTTEVVGMDELPSQALRNKKHSSMRVAVNLVKEGRAEACVSAGNTGALVAIARFVLKTLPGIDRPAIVASLPAKHKQEVRVLDLGAHVDSAPQHLLQYAVMGSILAAAVDNIANPRVALLNIGKEEIKGNELIKKTSELLEQHKSINYVGYVEGNTVFDGKADVVVCDGFVGNVMLKASEGAVELIVKSIKTACRASWWRKLVALPFISILRRVLHDIDPRKYNGATCIGLNGVVVKSHGGADEDAFAHAISQAILQVEKNILQLISNKIAVALEETKVT